jgi:hypothetical protein
VRRICFLANTYQTKGAGGPIGIIGLGDTGRLPSTTITTLETGSLVYDFDFNPFDDDMIAVGRKLYEAWTGY